MDDTRTLNLLGCKNEVCDITDIIIGERSQSKTTPKDRFIEKVTTNKENTALFEDGALGRVQKIAVRIAQISEGIEIEEEPKAHEETVEQEGFEI